MRLFAAVLPPAGPVHELDHAVDRLRSLPGADGLRWTDRAGWHLTLAFLGEVDEQLLPELAEWLDQAARRTEPFPLRLQGGGEFGGRALWAGVAMGVDELGLLAQRADAAARRAGVPMDEHRDYLAHLTLAHGPADSDLSPFVEALDGFEGTEWEVDELALVRSHLPVSGLSGEQPRYEAIARCPLGEARPGHPAGRPVGSGR